MFNMTPTSIHLAATSKSRDSVARVTGAGRVHYKGVMADSARWDAVTLRPDDIIITTPAKCGTTRTPMICALLIFQTTTFEQPLGVISPWIDMLTRNIDDIVADLDAQ